jgi:hypothetical protein
VARSSVKERGSTGAKGKHVVIAKLAQADQKNAIVLNTLQ